MYKVYPYQLEADEKYQKARNEQWKKEMKIEEKRRKEDQKHQLGMMQMLGQMMTHGAIYPPLSTSPYDFDYHNDTF